MIKYFMIIELIFNFETNLWNLLLLLLLLLKKVGSARLGVSN